MPIDNVRDLFVHELKDIYDAETRLVDALRQQANETQTSEIKQALENHVQQTETQRERLEQVFESLDMQPSRGEGCAGMNGLIEEHDTFKRQNPAAEILDAFNLTAAEKVERYEITAYEGLVNLAQQIGANDAVDLLNENLQEEKGMLEKAQNLMKTNNPLKNAPAGARNR